MPASNTKLFTDALALNRLGPNWIASDILLKLLRRIGPIATGRLTGSLWLVGDGDPNLSGRELPYRVDSPPGDGLQAIKGLANQIAAKGVQRIDGDIVGDDTAYVWDPYPESWGIGDALWEYGAPVSALTINDNSFVLTVHPGDPARIKIDPPFEFYEIDNRVRTGSPTGNLYIERDPGSMQIRYFRLDAAARSWLRRDPGDSRPGPLRRGCSPRCAHRTRHRCSRRGTCAARATRRLGDARHRILNSPDAIPPRFSRLCA